MAQALAQCGGEDLLALLIMTLGVVVTVVVLAQIVLRVRELVQ